MKGLGPFILMGNETSMTEILSEALKYDRKTVLLKEKKPESKEKEKPKRSEPEKKAVLT